MSQALVDIIQGVSITVLAIALVITNIRGL